MLNDKKELNYIVLFENCPLCGGRLIFNKMKECGELRCNYTEHTIINNPELIKSF